MKNSKTLCDLCNNEIHVPYVLRIRTVSNADGSTNRTIRQLLLMVRNSAAALDMTGSFCLIVALNLHFHNGGMVWDTTFVCSLFLVSRSHFQMALGKGNDKIIIDSSFLLPLWTLLSNGPWQRKWQDDYWFFLFATIMALVATHSLKKKKTQSNSAIFTVPGVNKRGESQRQADFFKKELFVDQVCFFPNMKPCVTAKWITQDKRAISSFNASAKDH